MRWTRTVALAGPCALAVAACGSSPHKIPVSVPATAPATTASGPATTTTGAASSTTTPTTDTATTPAQSNICRAAGLHLSFLGGQAATGHGLLGFELRNVGTSSCQTFGYPGIQFLAKSGSALPTTPTHTTHDFFGTTVLRTLTVAPGQAVSFRLGVTHFGPNGSSTGCTTAYGLQAIAPNDTATLRVEIPAGVYECGTATVSPVQPGSSAYP
jgi:hypothetical protein